MQLIKHRLQENKNNFLLLVYHYLLTKYKSQKLIFFQFTFAIHF
jgi:hypothetical protein